MPKLFIISNKWSEQPWFSTGGTRAKKYVQSPEGKFYYFKRSQLRPGREYTFEFWNEIIAYKLGTMLGFNMLRYDIAVDGEIMGCICESMIDSEQEELIEGIKYLQAYSPAYDPAKKEHQKWYTFDLIERALQSAKIDYFIQDIIQVIIFDSIIGNSDRHQENWAVISKQYLIPDLLIALEDKKEIKLSVFFKRLINWLKINTEKQKEKGEKITKLLYKTATRFSPIYDSGSSLGRELLDEKVNVYLTDDSALNFYIERGTAEIHWENKKVSHFDLITNLLCSPYKETVKNSIQTVLSKFNAERFDKMIQHIDDKVPQNLVTYKIPDNRKQLIIKMIALRLKKLEALIYEGV